MRMIALVLKYLLIVLVTAPVIAISTYLFINLVRYVNAKNREDRTVRKR